MSYGEFLSWLTAFFGVTSAFAYLHQAYWILKRKSAADVSLFTFIYFFLGQFAFVLFGFHTGQLNIILTFGLRCQFTPTVTPSISPPSTVLFTRSRLE